MLILAIFSLMTAVALPAVNITPLLFTRVASLSLLYGRRLSYNGLYLDTLGSGIGIYSGLFEVSSVSQYMDRFIFVSGAIILTAWAPMSKRVISAVQYVYTAVPTISEYSLIILFTTCGRSLLVSSRDLVSVYLSIELQSFAVYILATLYRQSESSTSSGLKYFLLGGLSSGLILLGSALIYAYTGLTNLEGIYSLLSVGGVDTVREGLGPCVVGITILISGFLFKVAAAPFHNWAPDVYDGTPTIVTMWLSIMPKLSIMVLLMSLRVGLEFNGASLTLLFDGISFDVWKNLLLISSLLSLVIGTVVGLAQNRLKRLLRYSTISHVGFLLFRLGISSEESIEAFMFYLVQYTLTNMNAFLVVLAFGYVLNVSEKSMDIKYIRELSGQFKSNPLLGLALTLCLFSMRGVPPLIGFFGKQMVLYSAMHRGYYFLGLVGIIVSVISASYYLMIVRVIHFDNKPRDSKENESNSITNVHRFRIATLTMRITLYMLNPGILLNSSTLLALSLYSL